MESLRRVDPRSFLCPAVIALVLVVSPWTLGGGLNETILSLREPVIDASEHLVVDGIEIPLPHGRIHLSSGHLVPARTAAGQIVGIAFHGQGRLDYDAPNKVEAQQLELFLGRTSIELDFSAGVLVFASNETAASIAALPRAAEGSAASDERRTQLEKAAKEMTAAVQARQLDLAYGLLDPRTAGGSLTASLWGFENEPDLKGRVRVYVDPFASEQLEISNTRSRRRPDVWTRASSGAAARDLEPTHYEIDATVAEGGENLTGRVTIRLRSERDGASFVRIEGMRGLTITRVLGSAGQPFAAAQVGRRTLVALGEALAAGREMTLVIEYETQAQSRVSRGLYRIRDSWNWYPHAGSIDLAPYEILLRHPKELGLFASGRVVETGEDGDQIWQRRRLDYPCRGVSYRVGDFVREQTEMDGISITLAVSRASKFLNEDSRKRLLANVAAALNFNRQMFGPYPLDHLTVVTAPDNYSQGSLGFITLSDFAIAHGNEAIALNSDDYRVTLAHEVAHQWWGNVVVPAEDRDRWISEAIASYASRTFGRILLARDTKSREMIRNLKKRWEARLSRGEYRKIDRLIDEGGWVDPLQTWREDLRRKAAGQVTVGEIGAISLGTRLESSLCEGCYVDIVYTKGGKVVDALAIMLGEDPFLNMLERMARQARGRKMSTEQFFAKLKRMSGRDLDGFADTFVYGTEIPLVRYRVSTGSSSTALGFQLARSGRLRWGVASKDGGLECTLERRPESTPTIENLFVAYAVGAETKDGGSGRIEFQLPAGTVKLPGATSAEAVRLDTYSVIARMEQVPSEMVLVHLRDATLAWSSGDDAMALHALDGWRKATPLKSGHPLRMVAEGLGHALASEMHLARGELELAEASIKALDRAVSSTKRLKEIDPQDLEWTNAVLTELLEPATHPALGDDRAPEWLEVQINRSQKLIFFGVPGLGEDQRAERELVKWQVALEARLHLLRGKTKKAYQLLWKNVLNDANDRYDANILLAIAAKSQGEKTALARATKRLRKAGIDTDVFDEGAAP